MFSSSGFIVLALKCLSLSMIHFELIFGCDERYPLFIAKDPEIYTG